MTQQSVILVLPYPISANDYWRSFVPKGQTRSVTIPSREAKAYKDQVGWIVKAAGVRKPITGRVKIDIKLYPKRPQDWQARMRKYGDAWDDKVLCIDLDNARKVLYDSLNGIVIEDDKWVWRDTAERMEPDGEARVVVKISPVPVKQPQAALFEGA